jgi:hypothetical protein
MNMISKSIKPRLEKDSRNFKPWIILWNTFGFKKLFRTTRQKRINLSSCDALPESLITFLQEFNPINRDVICYFSGYPVHELLLRICGKFMMSPSGRRIVIARSCVRFTAEWPTSNARATVLADKAIYSPVEANSISWTI